MKLSIHDGSDEVLVVDVALAVLVAHQQLLRLLVSQLLTKSGQEVTELGWADEAVAILVKVAQSFNKVVTSVSGPSGADCLWKYTFKDISQEYN